MIIFLNFDLLRKWLHNFCDNTFTLLRFRMPYFFLFYCGINSLFFFFTEVKDPNTSPTTVYYTHMIVCKIWCIVIDLWPKRNQLKLTPPWPTSTFKHCSHVNSNNPITSHCQRPFCIKSAFTVHTFCQYICVFIWVHFWMQDFNSWLSIYTLHLSKWSEYFLHHYFPKKKSG